MGLFLFVRPLTGRTNKKQPRTAVVPVTPLQRPEDWPPYNKKGFPLGGSSACRKSPFLGRNVGMGLDPSAPLAARSA